MSSGSPAGREVISCSMLAAIWAMLSNHPGNTRMQWLRDVPWHFPCSFGTIVSGASDAGATQDALPVHSHRVERLLGALLTLQSF